MGRSGPSTRGPSDPSWTVTGLRLSPGRQEQVAHALARTAELIERARPREGVPVDYRAARVALSEAWQDLTDAMVAGRVPGDRVVASVELLRQIRSAEEGVRDDQLARQSATTQAVREALVALRDVRSADELIELVPSAAAKVGFDRVLLSRIEDSTWVPERMYVARDARWAEEILQAGREHLRTLDGTLLETQIVRRHRPLVVSDIGRPNLHRALVDTAQTRSYTAAPIVAWGNVIGFLHADCYHQGRLLDNVDRDLLWMFCDGLGHLITRAAAIDALDSLRGELDRLAAGLSSFDSVGGWPAPGAGVAARPGPAGRSPEAHHEHPEDVEGTLTRREVDVMRLMGAGHTNAQIARRLVISEGTVKSHVKHILRKMQAANRAEAVSRWLRDEHARRGRADRREPAARVGA